MHKKGNTVQLALSINYRFSHACTMGLRTCTSDEEQDVPCIGSGDASRYPDEQLKIRKQRYHCSHSVLEVMLSLASLPFHFMAFSEYISFMNPFLEILEQNSTTHSSLIYFLGRDALCMLRVN